METQDSNLNPRRHIEAEQLAYYILIAALSVSVLGISYSRYLIYTAPFWLVLVSLTSPRPGLFLNSNLIPFAVVLIASILSSYRYGAAGYPAIVFLSVYIVAFSLFDFSRIDVSFEKLGILFCFLFLLEVGLKGKLGSGFSFSLLSSKSSFESTLSFSFGVIACYFLVSNKFGKAFLFSILALLALKRVVLLGLLIVFVLKVLPPAIARLILNRYVATLVTASITGIAVLFAQGYFDAYVVDLFGVSSNHLSQGRQELWMSLLQGADYDFLSFFIFGLGNGAAKYVLLQRYGADVLVHNDVLLLYIDFGLIVSLAFVLLLTTHKLRKKFLMSIFLLVLLLTDNVLIYQHVMLLYLLALSQIDRAERLASGD
jgi:hypothetical protein